MNRLKPGSVGEVADSSGFGYVQYVGDHPQLGGTLWVLPGLRATPPDDIRALPWETGYYAFFPARAAVRHGLLTVIGCLPLDDRAVPESLRRPGGRAPDGTILNWIISSGGSEQLVTKLDEPALSLPIGSIWNAAMLRLRIAERWRPESLL